MGRGRSGITGVKVARAPEPEETDERTATPGEPEEDERGFKDRDDRDYHELSESDIDAYYEKQKLTDAEKSASEVYTDPEVEDAWANPAADGLHSPSQDLNWAMSQGIPLSEEQETVRDSLLGAMHNTGENITMTRYDHAGFLNTILESLGVVNPDATTMSASDLDSLLRGVRYGENKFVSGSVNDFKTALGDDSRWNRKVFLQRYVKVTYQVDADVKSMMPGVSSKRDWRSGKENKLGELVMAPSAAGNQNYEIVGVKYSGAKAHPKGSRIDESMHLNQIEVVVRVHKQ